MRICSVQMGDEKWYPRATLWGELKGNHNGSVTEIGDDEKTFNTKKEADDYLEQKYKDSGYFIDKIK